MARRKRYTLKKDIQKLVTDWAKRENIEEVDVITRALILYDLVLRGCVDYQEVSENPPEEPFLGQFVPKN